MPNVLVRDLPDDVHAELVRRARARGTSLQQYLTELLRGVTEQPTLEDVFARVSGRSGGSVGLDRAAADLHDERAER